MKNNEHDFCRSNKCSVSSKSEQEAFLRSNANPDDEEDNFLIVNYIENYEHYKDYACIWLNKLRKKGLCG